ncbi:KH domain-containing protein [Ditylenchus destructor]|uniref:Ribosomal RNA-processing protein 40 n=1 Tax=Ditylenchus destructor TaxID=166010 RepID=A0AAD4NDX7_9BILA|nr:KH domain-containing protein [Ditylenchus destructor]
MARILIPEKRSDGIHATVPGVLRERDNKMWVVTSSRRYVPHAGDRILGVVTVKAGDFYRVDIGAADLALLSFMSFEGATKRNRPNVRVGDLIYGQIVLSSKHFEPELSCVDSEGRAHGMGVISTPGLVFTVALNYARKLLSPDDNFLSLLGNRLKFEITIGINGKVWLSGGINQTLAVRDSILEYETTFDSNKQQLVEKTVLNALSCAPTPMELS